MEDRVNSSRHTISDRGNAGWDKVDPIPVMPIKPRGYRVTTLPRATMPISEPTNILPRSESNRMLQRFEETRALSRSERSIPPPRCETSTVHRYENCAQPRCENCIATKSEVCLLPRCENHTPPRYERPCPLPRPEKNCSLFLTDSRADLSVVTAQQILEGHLGPLPILLTTSSGYFSEGFGSSLCLYENSEVLFAYKQDKQFRVLLQDIFQRTLSLPIHSDLTFCPEDAMKEELTVAQILSQYCLPVRMRFARSHELSFVVDKTVKDHSFFGPLQLTAVYDESFYWCLSIDPHGNVRKNPKVLPKNLVGVGFAPVTGIRGASDPVAKLKEFVDRYTHLAQGLRHETDPFFQDLALVSHGPAPVAKVEPYIGERTFIRVFHKTQGSPPPPYVQILHNSPSSTDLTVCRRQMKTSASTPCLENVDDVSYEEPMSTWPRMCVHTLPGRHADASYLDTEDSPDSDSRESSFWDVDEMCSTAFNQVSRPHTPSISPPRIPRRLASHDIAKEDMGSYDDLRFMRAQREMSSQAQSRSLDTLRDAEASGGWEDDPKGSSPDSGPAWKDTLDAISVEELSVKLKELGLQKYRKKFAKARIDGLLLQKLSEDTLRGEFRMQQLEMLRLNVFISEGHIPKRTVRRSQSARSVKPKLSTSTPVHQTRF